MPTGGHGHVICMGNLGEVVSEENTPDSCTETHKNSFFPYKQVGGTNGDHEWLRMTNAFILCDLVWKFQKRHAVNRIGIFKLILSDTKAYNKRSFMTMTITMTMTILYSTIDVQIEIIMYNSLKNLIINWSGDYY